MLRGAVLTPVQGYLLESQRAALRSMFFFPGGVRSHPDPFILIPPASESMRIGIAAGHSRVATPEQIWENGRCRLVADELQHLLDGSGFFTYHTPRELYDLPNDQALLRKIDFLNTTECDLAVELHINAGGGDYSTVLFWGTSLNESAAGQQLAEAISNQFQVALPWRAMGPRSQFQMGRDLAFLNHTQMPAVIPEPGFKDDAEQREFFNSSKGVVLYATTVFQGICRYCNGLVPA